MKPKEAVEHYLAEKLSGRLTTEEIKQVLNAEFGAEEATKIFKAIREQELYVIQNQQPVWVKFLASKGVSYFFILFGIIVVATSIYITTLEGKETNPYLPYLMIIGALFIIFKHVRNILK